jgi:heterodisulfide reductase subunit A-like polyferredoxin
MMPLWALLLFVSFLANAADVAVYAGAAAGVASAIQAAPMGKSVILVVPESHIGGSKLLHPSPVTSIRKSSS